MDMRPGEPMRSTLRDWVQACGKCGAAAWDLSTLPAGTKAVVESAPYHALSLEAAEDTRLFRRWAMICVAAGDQEMAAETTLMAAWAADDGADMVEAAKLRRDVAALWGEPADLSKALRLLDVLRRAGEFAAVETRGQKLAASGATSGAPEGWMRSLPRSSGSSATAPRPATSAAICSRAPWRAMCFRTISQPRNSGTRCCRSSTGISVLLSLLLSLERSGRSNPRRAPHEPS